MKMYALMLTSLLFRASSPQIIGDGPTRALYGEDVNYRCKLDNPTANVLQVTWQKRNGDQTANLASYSEAFGQQVNDPYLGKVAHTEVSLMSASITVKNVSMEDEGCYICLFSVYPVGSQRRESCLVVEGISAVNTQVQNSSNGLEVQFICSATGKPAPTIQWVFSEGAVLLNQPDSETVTHPDQTWTTKSSIMVRVHAGWNGHGDCLINTGVKGERRVRIPHSLPGMDLKNDRTTTWGLVAAFVAIALLITIIALYFFCQKRFKIKRIAGQEVEHAFMS